MVSDSGDNFVGTTFNLGIGNLVAVKISLMLLLFWPFWFAKRSIYNTLILVFLFIGWILTSALYSLLLGLFVITFFYFVNKLIHGFATFKFSASIIGVAIVSFLCIVVFVFTQPDNVGYLKASLKATYSTILDLPGEEQTIGKVLYYRRTLKDLPWEYPSMLLFGVGPGNYSSRSAWLVSGEYLLRQPSYIPITPSKVANDYTLSLWSKNLKSETFKGAGSILQQPFSTWLSVFAEFGLPGFCIFLLTFYTFYRRFKQINF
ncbi:MAG: hypothetical protein U5K54_06465 [Cytophagales bacterium]|nr:hypothetical protein [Cytophagales bacterium]